MRYVVIVEEGEKSFGAYVPDLPGCVKGTSHEDDAKWLVCFSRL
jgi:predicted RNase H-like HicB family nuclease